MGFIILWHSPSISRQGYVSIVRLSTYYLPYPQYMTEKETNTFINVLPSLVKTYNNRIHRMIQTTPYKAEHDEDEALKINILASRNREKLKKTKPKFKINDVVRIAKQKTKFSRGCDDQTQREMFEIWKIDTTKKILRKKPHWITLF